MIDRLLMVLEILLLIWIVVQGEYVRFYEREVFRMNRDRYEERAKWRREKQEQMRKKTTPKTSGFSANTESLLPVEMKLPSNKTSDVKCVAEPLMLTARPTSITSISEPHVSDISIPS